VSTLAGTGKEGHQNGEGSVAQFRHPTGVAVDGDGNLIVADCDNHRIRKITPQGHVSALAGTGEGGYREGEGTVAQFNKPYGVAVNGDGNNIVSDLKNHRIRKITSRGLVSTLAGTGEMGHRDGGGAIAQSSLWDGRVYHPTGLAVDGDGNVIVADKDNHRIRRITPQGQVSTLAGTGEKGHRDGEGTIAQFNTPKGIVVDGDGNVIVGDSGNDRIRKITPQGHVATLAGTGEAGNKDGDRVASAQFNYPVGVAVDENGNIIVADWKNHCIRCVASNGAVTPLFFNHSLPRLLQSSFASDIQHLFESGSLHDVTFVVEQERVPAHRAYLSTRCEYFGSMFSAGFLEGVSAEVHIEGTTSAAFKALLKYLYTDNMDEIDDAVLFDLAK
jgi:DNA-binding beta-propeller fold protein YncE